MRYIKSGIACKIRVVIFSLYLLLVGLRAETLGPDNIGESNEMIRGPENMTYEKTLKKLELFSLRKTGVG